MMQYSKGDTIEFQDERVIIILNDGMRGKKFVEQYNGHVIDYFSLFARSIKGMIVGSSWAFSGITEDQEEIWYYVLIGDKKGWFEERRLEQAKIGWNIKKKEDNAAAIQ